MPNSKRTIYKPKKGRNISQKKLYKLPSKRHGQKGGGFFDSLTSMLKGGEVPGSPKVDGDGNIVDVEEETPATEEEQTETPSDDGEEKESEESTETPVVEEDKTEEKNDDETETPVVEEEQKKGILKGLGETMGRSLSDATSEVQGYMTQPASENESSADVDNADVDSDNDDNSLMESSNVNIQVPCDELLAENKQLREK